jgi:hypothetical protein
MLASLKHFSLLDPFISYKEQGSIVDMTLGHNHNTKFSNKLEYFVTENPL